MKRHIRVPVRTISGRSKPVYIGLAREQALDLAAALIQASLGSATVRVHAFRNGSSLYVRPGKAA